MPKITEPIILEKAWREVNRVWMRGDLCGECEFFRHYDGSYMEEPYSQCGVMEGDDMSPFTCPGVKRSDVIETLAADAEEAGDAAA